MGRKHTAFTGLSRYVLDAFKQDGDSSTSATVSSSTSTSHPSSSSTETSSSHNFVSTQRSTDTNTQPNEASTSVTTVRKTSALEEEGMDVDGVEEGLDGAKGDVKGKGKAKAPPRKKRKVGLLGPGYEDIDATGLVPFYTDASEVPAHLKKYFYQRHRYFSLYDDGCLLDEEGWYSVTPERVAAHTAERCRCGTVLDAFCGVGGNAIAFAQTCERVIALDTSPTRLALARHNAAIYGVANRIEFILADYLSFAESLLSLPSSSTPSSPSSSSSTSHRKIDVVFLSPPWGGPEYISGPADTTTGNKSKSKDKEEHPEFSLDAIKPIPGDELFRLTRRITKNVAYFLPRNTSLEEIGALLPTASGAKGDGGGGGDGGGEESRKEKETGETEERIEVEEAWMGPKLKALTVYFGGLVAGQEHMFDEGS